MKKLLFLTTVAGFMLSGCKIYDCCMSNVIVAESEITIGGNDGDTGELIFTCPISWTMSGLPSWLSAVTSGTGNATIVFEALGDNPEAGSRFVTLTFMASNGDKFMVKVTQDVFVPPVAGVTIVFPDDFPPLTLQTLPVFLIDNSLFPGTSLSGNSVTVNGDVPGVVCGGFTDGADLVTNNQVIVNSGTVGDTVFGGYSDWGGDATHNSVTIGSGSKVEGSVVGGRASWGNAMYNSVTINGGEIVNNVVGGTVNEDNATYNTVTISGSPIFGALVSLSGGGGNPFLADTFTGNTLNVWDYSGGAVYYVTNFEFINFRFPHDQTGAVLGVTNEAFLGNGTIGSTIDIEVTGATLTVGDKVTLIDAVTLTLDGFSQATATGGGYTWSLAVEGGNKLVAEVLVAP